MTGVQIRAIRVKPITECLIHVSFFCMGGNTYHHVHTFSDAKRAAHFAEGARAALAIIQAVPPPVFVF